MRALAQIFNLWSEPNIWDLPDRPVFSGTLGEKETIGNDFTGYVRDIYKANGIAFACILVRQLVFSEVRFQWRNFRNGRPTDLYGSDGLSLIEKPWPNGSTGELLSRMEQDDSLAGNSYTAVVEDGTRLRRLRPDWTTVVTGSPSGDPFDPEARPVGYIYQPRLTGRRSEPTFYTVERVAHFTTIPDPVAQWRGMSWLTPVLEEIKGDKAAAKHKLKFFENGAQPGLIISYRDIKGLDKLKEQAEYFAEQHEGLGKAYKTVHLGGGADPKSVGANLQQADFKITQGAGESRIAAASGLGAVMAQFSEGLAGSSLNAGNFTAARKRAETILFRPRWRIAATVLGGILPPPPQADASTQLWYDARDVAFLRDDAKEEADIRQKDAFTIRNLTDAGFEPDSVVSAVTSGNWQLLIHTGLYSVQLQPPGPDSQASIAVPAQAVEALLAAGWKYPEENAS